MIGWSQSPMTQQNPESTDMTLDFNTVRKASPDQSWQRNKWTLYIHDLKLNPDKGSLELD